MNQSKTDARYYKLPDLFGFAKVLNRMIWGKKHMIEFLVKLEKLWTGGMDSVYEQIETHGNFAKIPIGDISKEGGGPPRSNDANKDVKSGGDKKVYRFNGHRSHRCGVDIDIYVVSTTGQPSSQITPETGNFDFERTSELARAILIAGGKDITDIWIGDKRLVKLLNDQKQQHTKIWADSPQHDNHFHVRLQNKGNDQMCF